MKIQVNPFTRIVTMTTEGSQDEYVARLIHDLSWHGPFVLDRTGPGLERTSSEESFTLTFRVDPAK